MIGQDLSEQFLNVVVGSASDDGSHEFDLDADFPIDIDLAFHTLNIAQDQPERKREIANGCAYFCHKNRLRQEAWSRTDLQW